jgi:hypothetical protein
MAGSETRREREKYLSLEEHVAECLANNSRLKRGWCPVIDWLKRQPSETIDDVIAAELYVQRHPEWGPSYCCDVIRDTWRFNTPDAVETIQHDHALSLVRHPWAAARRKVEALLSHEDTKWESREALQLVLDYFAANHPNPKAHLAQAHVRARLPQWVEITHMPCPDFPELKSHVLRGNAALPGQRLADAVD